MFRSIRNFVLNIVNKINISIRAKLVIIFAIATIIPLGIVGVVSYTKYFATMEETISQSTSQIAEQLNRNLELFFNNLNKTLSLGDNELLIRFIDETDNEKKYVYAKEIGELFNIYKGVYDFEEVILDINVIGLNGNSISDRVGAYTYYGDLENIPIYNKAIAEPNKLHIILNYSNNYSGRIDYNSSLTMVKTIRRPLTKEIKGIILVDIDKKAIENICSNIELGDTGQFFVVTQDGQYIYDPNKTIENNSNFFELNDIKKEIEKNKQGHFVKEIDDEKLFYVFNTLKMPGWSIIGKVRLEEIMKSAYEIKTLTIVIEGILILAVILLYVLISNTLTMPIRELRNKMKLVEKGDLNVVANYLKRDEIADLCKGFNAMLINIKELMKNNLVNQEKLKKSEFKAMQAQINPHFLYNTLDAIVWMTEANNKDEVVKITKDLSNFFRIVLSKGKEWITIRDEITHIKSYLNIQKVRYRDILEFDIDIETGIFEYKILKLTLQPIIENALYHGLKNKRGGGFIMISGSKLNKENLVFEIIDNGIGMTPEKLLEVSKEMTQMQGVESSSFGLKNVNERIKLYYGDEYGLSIESEYNIGTSVKIILPINSI